MGGAIRSRPTRLAKALHGIDLKGLRIRLFDAENQIVGHMATQIATVLQGKDKPTCLPSRDHGDVCIVQNASKVMFTGKKWDYKIYRWHTGQHSKNFQRIMDVCLGYPGGLKERKAKEMFARRPEDIIWRAVSGMLPKNKLQEARLRKLLIFPNEHDLKDVDMIPWETPPFMIKKLHKRQGKLAPKVKGWH